MMICVLSSFNDVLRSDTVKPFLTRFLNEYFGSNLKVSPFVRTGCVHNL